MRPTTGARAAMHALPHGAGAVRLRDAQAAPVEPVIRPDARAAAFFDLDNTIVQGASIFHFAKGMYRRGFLDARTIAKALWFQTYFRAVGREKAAHVVDARETMLSFIAGRTVTEITEVGEQVYEDSVAARIWPGTRALAQLHLDAGQQVWLVTAAPVEMAGIIASHLGLTGALGTVAEHDEGVYTGRLVGGMLHGPAKADAVRDLTAEHDLDLARSFAYSDSYNDLPMLSLVGHPCAVNPDRRLAAHAGERDWLVRDFRRGRRAARFGVLGAGSAGAVAAGVAVTRRLRRG